jgi:ribonuclease BN (tRNA processing enzyme)
MPKLIFTILGSSAGMPQPDRVNAGYVLDIEGQLLQFDCGGGVAASFRRAGFDPLAVERIIISHTHADHISDLPLFLQMMHLAGRESGKHSEVDVFIPGEAIETVQAYLRTGYLHPEKLTVEYRLHAVPEDGVIETDGASILPIPNAHLKVNADIISEFGWKNKMQCYSYLIRSDNKSLLYSADLGSEVDISPYLNNLDVLVVESTHIDIKNLLDIAVDKNVGRVILSHVDADLDVEQVMNLAGKLGMNNVSIAQDGMQVEL